MSSSAVTVSFYCHTCSARLPLPAPSSPLHFTLCPRCRKDYLNDSPTPPHQAPQPVLPPAPPPCAVPWPSRSISSFMPLPLPLPPPTIPSSSSLASSKRVSLRSYTTAETTSMSQDLLPPALPPWLHDPWNKYFNSLDCPPRPPPIRHVSSSSTALPRTLVSPGTRPSSSSTSKPSPTSSKGTWDLVARGKEERPPSTRSDNQVCREFGVLCPQEEKRRQSSSAVSPLSSAYSSACSSTPLASLPLHRQHHGELQPDSLPLALSPSKTAVTMPTSPPPLPWNSSLHGPWDDEYIFSPSDSDSDSDYQLSPPRPPPVSGYQSPPRPPPPPVSTYDGTFEIPFQRRSGPRAGVPPPPVFAYDATFDTPLQQGASQAAPAESIAALPTVTVADTALVCSICTDPLLVSAPARRLPCNHLYHSDCIVTWLSLRNSCPVCRGSIPMFHSTATDSAFSLSPTSLYPTPPGRRRSLAGTRRISRICSRLLRRTEINRDSQTE